MHQIWTRFSAAATGTTRLGYWKNKLKRKTRLSLAAVSSTLIWPYKLVMQTTSPGSLLYSTHITQLLTSCLQLKGTKDSLSIIPLKIFLHQKIIADQRHNTTFEPCQEIQKIRSKIAKLINSSSGSEPGLAHPDLEPLSRIKPPTAP